MRQLLLLCSFLLLGTASAQPPQLWGMTKAGGAGGLGTIFRINLDGTGHEVVHSFDSLGGSRPEGGLCLAPDGWLYGLTREDGANDQGTAFRIDPVSGTYEKVADMATGMGARPWSSFIVGNDGRLYASGIIDLIRYDPVIDELEHIADLSVNEMLVQGSDGWIYGADQDGGTNGIGTIFRVDPLTLANEVLRSFAGEDGDRAYGRLCQAPNGKFYGMTYQGGLYGDGVIYEYDIAGDAYVKLMDLDGPNGSSPWSGFIVLGPDKLLGSITLGGAFGNGALVELEPSTGTITLVHSFATNTDGSLLFGGLVAGPDGMVYGMTSNGGDGGEGTIYRYDPLTQQVTTLHSFAGAAGGELVRGELVVVNGSVGTNAELRAQAGLQVAPNPAEEFVTVTFPDDARPGDRVELRDMTGRAVWQGRCEGRSQHIALPPLSGCYLLIHWGQRQVQQRTVVVR